MIQQLVIALGTATTIMLLFLFCRWVKYGSVICALGLHRRNFPQDRGLSGLPRICVCARCAYFVARWARALDRDTKENSE